VSANGEKEKARVDENVIFRVLFCLMLVFPICTPFEVPLYTNFALTKKNFMVNGINVYLTWLVFNKNLSH